MLIKKRDATEEIDYYEEEDIYTFDFWGDAIETYEALLNSLTCKELEKLWDYVEYMFKDYEEVDDYMINNYFEFEQESIAEILGYDSYEEMINS